MGSKVNQQESTAGVETGIAVSGAGSSGFGGAGDDAFQPIDINFSPTANPYKSVVYTQLHNTVSGESGSLGVASQLGEEGVDPLKVVGNQNLTLQLNNSFDPLVADILSQGLASQESIAFANIDLTREQFTTSRDQFSEALDFTESITRASFVDSLDFAEEITQTAITEVADLARLSVGLSQDIATAGFDQPIRVAEEVSTTDFQRTIQNLTPILLGIGALAVLTILASRK